MDEKRLTELARYVVEDARPERALRALVELRAGLDEAEREHVCAMVAGGAPWREVGTALGISPQAAHKRHGSAAKSARGAADDAWTGRAAPGKVLVTGQARRAVQYARVEAADLGVAALGTEHVLLGIMRLDGTAAARALEAAGVSLPAVRSNLLPTLTGDEHADRPSERNLAVSETAREAFERSLSESVRRGDGYIGPEHLLLSILHDGGGGAAQTLRSVGVEPHEVERQLARRC